MQVHATEIPDVKLLRPRVHGDSRGALMELFNAPRFAAQALPGTFVQDNVSFSKGAGVVRGLHYQIPPHAQGKLIMVLRGAVFDVAVDLRRDSPSFGRHVAVELSAERWELVYVPPGFAHGFCTLEPATSVLYKLTDVYAPDCERGILWSDPDLGIRWPLTPSEATVSDKDGTWPSLAAAAGEDLF